MRRTSRRAAPVWAAGLAGAMIAVGVGTSDPASAVPVADELAASSSGMTLVGNLPKSGIFEHEHAIQTDLAFQGDYVYVGNYDGFQVVDVRHPRKPVLVAQVDCPGSQNDLAVYGDLLFTATDTSRAFPECYRDGVRNFPRSASAPADQTWEGVRVFDVSNPAHPQLVRAVETDCGARSVTLLPDEPNNRALLYVSSYGPSSSTPDCQPPHDKISIVEVPLNNPAGAAVVAEPVLFADGGFPGSSGTTATSGCSDITVFPERSLAAGACMGQGVLLDISNPASPVVIASLTDPNFSFWDSAWFSNDATKVVFTDHAGGGISAACTVESSSTRAAAAIYDIADPQNPQFLSYYKIPRTQAANENCAPAGGTVLPVQGHDVFVQGWYQGGVSVVDFTDGSNPVELAWFDRSPHTGSAPAGSWAAYPYRGFVYSSELQRGLDVLRVDRPVSGKLLHVSRLNPQTQEPLRQ